MDIPFGNKKNGELGFASNWGTMGINIPNPIKSINRVKKIITKVFFVFMILEFFLDLFCFADLFLFI